MLKKIVQILSMVLIVFALMGCQPQVSTEQTGVLQVNVTWQTDVWKPGPSGTITLPDTNVQIHKIFSTEIFRNGVTDLLGEYRDETIPTGWYWVEAFHHPEGVRKSDYGKHWVAHLVHIQPDKEVLLDFRFENAGGWKIQ